MIEKQYSSESIHKPAKQSNPDLRTGAPLWEEEVNDLTGASVGWLSLFHVEGTEEFRVEYRDLAKRRAIKAAVDAKAEKAKAIATEKFAESVHLDDLTVEVDGTAFDVYHDTWVDAPETEVHVNAYPHYAEREEWIYDVTDNKLGKFIINGWQTLNPKRFADLPKTPEELEARNRRWAQEYAAVAAEEEVMHS